MPVSVDDAAWRRSISEVALIRDYAIRTGRKPTVEILSQIDALAGLPTADRDASLAQIMAALAALVAPVTLAEILDEGALRLEQGRRQLIVIGVGAVIALIGVTIGAIFMSSEVIGTEMCGMSCNTIFTALILGYGACLGLIGAIAYELFHASGIVRSNEYGVFDPYRSTARVTLGVTFGWIFSVTISLVPLSRIFAIDLSPDAVSPDKSLTDYAIILLPFLVGYSSSLITGLLNHLVDGIRTVFGMTPASTTEAIVVRPAAAAGDVANPTPRGLQRFLAGR